MSPHPQAGTMKVELDKRALFALASDTRVDILRALQPMRRTVTQLAEAMGIDKAAVHRHLQKLVEGELVKRYDDHGFVYYGLSWKARDLLAPNENTKVIILLGSAVVSALGLILAVLMFALALASPLGGPAGPPGTFPGASPGPVGSAPRAPDSPVLQAAQAANPLVWSILAAILAAVLATCLILAWRGLRRPKQGGVHQGESVA